MTSRERVLAALNHKEPDRVPLDLGCGRACKFTKKFYDNLVDALGMPEKKDNVEIHGETIQTVYPDNDVLNALGCDIIEAPWHWEPDPDVVTKNWEDSEGRHIIDEWGTHYFMSNKTGLYFDAIEFPLEDAEDEEDDAAYAWPKTRTPADISVETSRKYQQDGFATICTKPYGDGFLCEGPFLYGYENWLVMLGTEPERVRKILDKLLEKKIEHWDKILNKVGDSVDIICECDDMGAQAGPLISMDMFKNLILPYYKELCGHIHKTSSAKFFLHSCGSIKPFIPHLIEAGVDILNPVQFTSADMDLNELKRDFGQDITFWGGGIDTQHTLVRGSKADVRDMVKRNLDILKKGGGYVFSTVHNVQADVPVENFMEMLNTFRENCKY